MRLLLLVATLLVLLAGLSLFVFPERTADWFSWTVSPPLTAVFLGSAYWASAAVEWTSSRATLWADARVAVPGVFTFTALTLGVTILHLDKFHLGAEFPVQTQVLTWAWIAIYAIVPVLMAVLWVRQNRLSGSEPPRRHPLPRLLLVALAVVAAGLLLLGCWLLVAPLQIAEVWPWELTPLTGRAIGAWLVGLGVSAVQTVREADARRTRPVAVGAVVLPVLAGIGMVRYPDDVAWGTPQCALFVGSLVVWLTIGAAIMVIGRRSPVAG